MNCLQYETNFFGCATVEVIDIQHDPIDLHICLELKVGCCIDPKVDGCYEVRHHLEVSPDLRHHAQMACVVSGPYPSRHQILQEFGRGRLQSFPLLYEGLSPASERCHVLKLLRLQVRFALFKFHQTVVDLLQRLVGTAHLLQALLGLVLDRLLSFV